MKKKKKNRHILSSILTLVATLSALAATIIAYQSYVSQREIVMFDIESKRPSISLISHKLKTNPSSFELTLDLNNTGQRSANNITFSYLFFYFDSTKLILNNTDDYKVSVVNPWPNDTEKSFYLGFSKNMLEDTVYIFFQYSYNDYITKKKYFDYYYYKWHDTKYRNPNMIVELTEDEKYKLVNDYRVINLINKYFEKELIISEKNKENAFRKYLINNIDIGTLFIGIFSSILAFIMIMFFKNINSFLKLRKLVGNYRSESIEGETIENKEYIFKFHWCNLFKISPKIVLQEFIMGNLSWTSVISIIQIHPFTLEGIFKYNYKPDDHWGIHKVEISENNRIIFMTAVSKINNNTISYKLIKI